MIAYSTCSQLGYMFVAAGVGAYQAAMFHLFTHAFFKALLFLGAGSVIHAMDHEQDMRRYGGLAKIPKTYWAMMIGTIAITGIGHPADPHRLRRLLLEGRDHRAATPGRRATDAAYFAFVLLVIFVRRPDQLLFLAAGVLHLQRPRRAGPSADDHAHESPRTMLIPLVVLAAGAILAGMIGTSRSSATMTP